MKCDGCSNEIHGKEYRADHYDTIDDENGLTIAVEPNEGCPFVFCETCALGETRTNGFRSLVMKRETWKTALTTYRNNDGRGINELF